jgi:hypothetical protein
MKSCYDLESELLTREMRYRKLVEQTVSIELQGPLANVALRPVLSQLEDERRSALRECNRFFGLLHDLDRAK